MQTTQFEASLRERAGVAVVDLAGDVDGRADEALSQAYAQARARDPVAVLLNFAGVGYINSTGIALIVGLLAQARRDRTRLLCSGLSDHYRQIFEITRLADFMELHPDEDSAVGSAPAAGDGGPS